MFHTSVHRCVQTCVSIWLFHVTALLHYVHSVGVVSTVLIYWRPPLGLHSFCFHCVIYWLPRLLCGCSTPLCWCSFYLQTTVIQAVLYLFKVFFFSLRVLIFFFNVFLISLHVLCCFIALFRKSICFFSTLKSTWSTLFICFNRTAAQLWVLSDPYCFI